MKRFNTYDVALVLLCVLGVSLILCILGVIGYAVYDSATVVEVETYTVGCEVSQVAYAEENLSKRSSKPSYKMGVRNDDFAVTFDITDIQFAKYIVGDVVEVEVTVWEHHDGRLEETYKLLG